MVAPTLPKTETLEVAKDYTIVIPPSVTESLGFRPGQKIQVLAYKGEIVLMPEVHLRELRGSLPDLDTTVERDEDRV